MKDARIDWKLYPRLATVFQNRPDESAYCRDLSTLLDATSNAATSKLLAHLEKTSSRG